MTIGAISFQPYVYNVNSISPASMNRLSRISDDVLDKKVDYSELAENENPLQKGQTLDFQGMLEMQMQRGRYNASRIMKNAEQEPEGVWAEEMAAQNNNEKQIAAMTGQPEDAVQVETTELVQSAVMDSGSGNTESAVSNFRMQQAINAYEMSMTA